jgi:hypothetical protein
VKKSTKCESDLPRDWPRASELANRRPGSVGHIAPELINPCYRDPSRVIYQATV